MKKIVLICIIMLFLALIMPKISHPWNLVVLFVGIIIIGIILFYQTKEQRLKKIHKKNWRIDNINKFL